MVGGKWGKRENRRPLGWSLAISGRMLLNPSHPGRARKTHFFHFQPSRVQSLGFRPRVGRSSPQ